MFVEKIVLWLMSCVLWVVNRDLNGVRASYFREIQKIFDRESFTKIISDEVYDKHMMEIRDIIFERKSKFYYNIILEVDEYSKNVFIPEVVDTYLQSENK